MQYVMVIYESKDRDIRNVKPDDPYLTAWRAYHKALVASGAYITGAPLQPFPTATTVRIRDGKRQVQDGPYADTKEQLGGFIIAEFPNLEAALDAAARTPAASSGCVEVRPVARDFHDAVDR